jgi:hypothetical protein
MSYIPYYYDNDVIAVILILWIIIGTFAVVQVWRKGLPKRVLKRCAMIAGGGAVISLILYNGYILERQSVEAHNHMTFGEPGRPRNPQ